MSGPPVVHLTFTAGSQNGAVYDLPAGRFVVGRSTDCDLVLTDAGVSGRHAEITIDPRGRVTVADLGSLNGTWVDGERIDGAWGVGDGSRLAFGPISAVLAVPGAAATAPTAAAPAAGSSRSKAGLVAIAAIAAVALIGGGFALAQALEDDPGGEGSTGTVTAASEPPPTTSTAPAPKPKPKPLTREQRLERARDATLRVLLPDGWGSGFVVGADEGRPVIVTNAHVVGDATEAEVSRDREEGRPATVLGVSQCDDLAVVRADERMKLPVLPLGAQPTIGEDLWIVGFPGTIADQEAPLQVHTGPVASVGASYTDRERDLVATYRNLVQVDGTINSGNSGGPLVEQRRGRVVGVAAFGASAQEENYGISVVRLRELLPYLRDGSSVPGMALGFDEEGGDPEPSILDVTSDTLERQGVAGNGGQRLVAVDGKRFDEGAFPNGLASLCDELPTVFRRWPDDALPYRPAPRPVRGGEEKAGHEGKMVDEEAELRLVSLPMRRAVEGEGEENHIGRGEERDLREIGAGDEADDEQHLENRGDPGEEERERKARARDIARRGVDVGELEVSGHGEHAGKDKPTDKDGDGGPEGR